MAWTTIWQNPSDAGDRIEFDGTVAGFNMYRFTSDTSYLVTFERQGAPLNKVKMKVSGGSYPGEIHLNAAGSVYADDDFTLTSLGGDVVVKNATSPTTKNFVVKSSTGDERLRVANDSVKVVDALSVQNAAGTDRFVVACPGASFQIRRHTGGTATMVAELAHNSGEMATMPILPFGLRIPPVNTDPSAPPANGGWGSCVFNHTNNKLWIYNGTAWKSTTLT